MDRRGWLGVLFAGFSLSASKAGAEVGGVRKYRAVFDMTGESSEKWDSALRNIENLRIALGAENVSAQLVVHGKAFPLLQKSNEAMAERLQELHKGGVRLSLCRNTMKRFSVAPETLFPFTDTVDAAVAELVRKQEAGWAYLKVGV